MKINICKMSLSDLDLISDVLSDNFDNLWTYNIFKEELSSSCSTYWVAKLKTDIIGFAGFKFIFDEAELMNIVIHKSYRDQGVGSLLLEHLINQAYNMNISNINLEVAKNNMIAIHMYEKLGFKKIGFRNKYYGTQGAILMKLIF